MRFKNLKIGSSALNITIVKGVAKSNIITKNSKLEVINDYNNINNLYQNLLSISINGGHGDTRLIIDDKINEAITLINNYYSNQVVEIPTAVEVQPKEVEAVEEIKENKEVESVKKIDKKLALSVDKKIVDFFKDFNIDIAYSSRFKNTLKLCAERSNDEAISYVENYVKLIGHPDADMIISKLKSIEFEDIINNIKLIGGNTKVNNRLELIFGPAGTGKTYQAINDNPSSSVINCHSNMEPQDLLTKYIFIDGKPVEVKSPLIEAMEEGKAIILDEISLLSYECLAMLQGYLDNKKSFNLFINGKNELIQIKEGFKVVGTMNLIVNGRELYLPEPLVDRACIIKELKYNPKNLFWI